MVNCCCIMAASMGDMGIMAGDAGAPAASTGDAPGRRAGDMLASTAMGDVAVGAADTASTDPDMSRRSCGCMSASGPPPGMGRGDGGTTKGGGPAATIAGDSSMLGMCISCGGGHVPIPGLMPGMPAMACMDGDMPNMNPAGMGTPMPTAAAAVAACAAANACTSAAPLSAPV